MRRLPLLLLLLASGCGGDGAGPRLATSGPPIANTTQGLLRGARLPGGVVVFRGVPYARPPVGDRRWRAPGAPASWRGERDATSFAPACPQGGGAAAYYRRAARRLGRDTTAAPGLGPTSEDCLYLNVWTAATGEAEAAPVLVWVHGGAGTGGAGSDPLHRGRALAKRGVVVVTLNYRLGPLGFLAHPVLSAEDPRGVSGNYALLDLVEALRWIRRNARAFGGDPARVTLAGQSAGGTLVETLMVVPEARGLFHRVASHSATRPTPAPLRADGGAGSGEAAGVRFLRRLGVGEDADPAALRALPADSLVAAAARAGADVPAEPVVDGRLLPDRPARLWARGEFARVPIFKGSVEDEFALFMPPEPLPPADYRAWAVDRFDTLAPAVLDARPPGADAEASRRQRVRVLSDELFRAPTVLLLRWTEGRAPVHLYRFAWTPDDGAVGAFHGVDLPFLFGTHDAAGWWDESPYVARLTDALQGAWTRFAASGAPEDDGLPAWPSAGPEAPRVMVLDGEPRVETPAAADALRALADRLERRISRAR